MTTTTNNFDIFQPTQGQIRLDIKPSSEHFCFWTSAGFQIQPRHQRKQSVLEEVFNHGLVVSVGLELSITALSATWTSFRTVEPCRMLTNAHVPSKCWHLQGSQVATRLAASCSSEFIVHCCLVQCGHCSRYAVMEGEVALSR